LRYAARESKINRVEEALMSGRWGILAVVLALVTTLLNAAVFVAQLSTPASARSTESKLLSDDDFVDGLAKLVRKTVRDYCTVGKRGGIDC
jgi:hypothetical protein